LIGPLLSSLVGALSLKREDAHRHGDHTVNMDDDYRHDAYTVSMDDDYRHDDRGEFG